MKRPRSRLPANVPAAFIRKTSRLFLLRAPATALSFVLALALMHGAGCSAPPPPMQPSPQSGPPAQPAPGSPAAECLANANAKRERRPNEPPKISVKHVLIKYAGADRADANVTRTREQACMRALEARDKLREGADIAEVVREYSEEPGAATREGVLAGIERAEVAPPFADAAFELDVSQLSDVVETPFGFHVILRTD